MYFAVAFFFFFLRFWRALFGGAAITCFDAGSVDGALEV